MNDDDELSEEQQRRMMAKLVRGHKPKSVPVETRRRRPKQEEENATPRPVKVLVERVREWGNIEARSMGKANAVHWRYFFYGVDAAGTRSPLFSTTSEVAAKNETERYQKMGIPVEVLKERNI